MSFDRINHAMSAGWRLRDLTPEEEEAFVAAEAKLSVNVMVHRVAIHRLALALTDALQAKDDNGAADRLGQIQDEVARFRRASRLLEEHLATRILVNGVDLVLAPDGGR